MLEADLKVCERVFREIKERRHKKKLSLYTADNEVIYLSELILSALINYRNKRHANYIELHNAVLFNSDKDIKHLIYNTYEEAIVEIIMHCITILKKENINISKLIKAKIMADV